MISTGTALSWDGWTDKLSFIIFHYVGYEKIENYDTTKIILNKYYKQTKKHP